MSGKPSKLHVGNQIQKAFAVESKHKTRVLQTAHEKNKVER